MNWLPVVERELRVGARRRAFFWTRLLAAGVAILIGASNLWFAGQWSNAANLGQVMFQTLSGLTFLFCLAAGPIFAADILSVEKREGTLGLLFLTDLKGHDVVLGKLAASSVIAVFCLLATLPVMAIPLMVGGVALAEFGRMVLVLGHALFFSLSVSMLVSVASHHARSAFALVCFALFLSCVVLGWLGEFWGGAMEKTWIGSALLGFNPVRAMNLASAAQFKLKPEQFTLSIIELHGASWGLLAAASLLIGRAWRDSGRSAVGTSWAQRFRRWDAGSPEQRQRRRSHLLDANPVLWLASRHRLKQRILWGFATVSIAVWLCTQLLGGEWQDSSTVLVVGLFLMIPIKWLMASEATHRWLEERQAGALELLLTTPLTVREILAGQMAALRRLFLWPAAAVVGLSVLLLLTGSGLAKSQRAATEMCLAVCAVFLLDLVTLAYVGAWGGLRGKRLNQTFLVVLLKVLALPWLAFLVLTFIFPLDNTTAFAVSWFAVSAVTDAWLWFKARRRLLGGFREAAAGLHEVSAPAEDDKNVSPAASG